MFPSLVLDAVTPSLTRSSGQWSMECRDANRRSERDGGKTNYGFEETSRED